MILIAPLVRTGLYYTYFNEILLSVCFKVAFLLENNECKNGIYGLLLSMCDNYGGSNLS